MAQLRMNIIINIKFSANVLPLTIFALFAYSCTKENETTGARIYEGEKIPMSIKMGARNTTADDDEVIKSVRAIVFNDKNELVYNDVSDASINVDNIYIAPIRAARMPAVLPAILLKSVLLAIAAGWAAQRFGRISIPVLVGVVLTYQAVGTLGEWMYIGNFYNAVQDFRIGIPGMCLQVFGGYLFIRYLIRK